MAEAEGDDQPERRRRKRGLLKMFYGSNETAASSASADPLDIDGNAFKAPVYVEKLYGSYGLEKLMSREEQLTREIKALDSDMQTLVYENYNKFISATETIRNMKHQVDSMEEAMANLSASMEATTELSAAVNDTLAPRRERIKKLAGGHLMLKKLQFLFELPARLNQCVKMGALGEAVAYYARAARVLHHYREMDSFKGIYDECTAIVAKLQETLQEKADSPELDQQELVETYGLLLKLTGNADTLADRLLERTKDEWRELRDKQDQAYLDYVKEYPQLLKEYEEAQAAGTLGTKSKGRPADERGEPTPQIPEEDGRSNAGNSDGAADDGDAADDDDDAAAAELEGQKRPAKKKGAFDFDEEDEDTSMAPKGDMSDSDLDIGNQVDKPEGEGAEAQASGSADGGSADEAVEEAVEEEDAKPLPPLAHFTDYGNRVCFLNLAEWIICYQDTFLEGQAEKTGEGETEAEGDAGAKAEATEKAPDVGAKLVHFVQLTLVEGYLAAVERRLTEAIDGGEDHDSIISALESLFLGIEKMHGLVPMAGLDEAVAEVAVRVSRHAAAKSGQDLEAAVAGAIGAARKSLAERLDIARLPAQLPDIDKASTAALETLQEAAVRHLDALKQVLHTSFADSHAFFARDYPTRSIRRGVLKRFIDACEAHCTVGSTDGPSVAGDECSTAWELLCLYQIASVAASQLLPQVMGACSQSFPVNQRSVRDADELARSDAVGALESCARRLLQAFTMAAGASLTSAVCVYVSKLPQWATPPQAPHKDVLGIMEGLQRVVAAVAAVWGTTSDKPTGRKRRLASFSSKVQTGVVSTVMKLFSDEIVIFQETKPTQESITVALTRAMLRALVERVRLTTLPKDGLHQLQVDVCYIHDRLGEYPGIEEDETAINTLCGQIMTAGVQRSAAAELLPSDVLEEIVATSSSTA